MWSVGAQEKAEIKLAENMLRYGEKTPGLASVRRQFVTNGTKYQPKLTAKHG